MTFRNRSASYLAVATFFMGLAAVTSAASAQDVMQLDSDFKNGLLSTHGSERRQEASAPQRRETRGTQAQVEVNKRNTRGHRGQRR